MRNNNIQEFRNHNCLSRLEHQASESQNDCFPYMCVSHRFPKQLFLVILRDNTDKPLHQLEDGASLKYLRALANPG